jgi:N-acetylglucosamine kinase-like BadF-type ATPase
MHYFLGADIGATKTHTLIADETGRVIGAGNGGPGNHETVGYEGFRNSLSDAVNCALKSAALGRGQITGAGFGVAGYDWPSEKDATLAIVRSVGIEAPLQAVNDAILGILAGARDGWGVAVVSGTGCNCWGWDRERQHIGQMTGGGLGLGEAAGATEIVEMAVRAVGRAWTRRDPPTELTEAFVEYARAADTPDLLAGIMDGRYRIGASAAPLVFRIAAAGDAVALDLIRWAGRELGEMANAVIRQLGFERLSFDVVQLGSMFDGSPLLTEEMRTTIAAIAPEARVLRLGVPAVTGAVLLGLEAAAVQPDRKFRARLEETSRLLFNTDME